MKNNIISVFSKPWRECSAAQLAEHVLKLGFDSVEFPLRDGYQVEPKNAVRDFPKFVAEMKGYGVSISSVASDITEPIFEACGAAGVKLIRLQAEVDLSIGYMKSEAKWVKQYNDILPWCEKYDVKVGIQQHSGTCAATAMDMRHLLERIDNPYVGIVWDAGHSGAMLEPCDKSLDIIWDYLVRVNFKSIYVKQVSENPSRFRKVVTTARQGVVDWEQALNYLFKRGYEGPICVPPEYSDLENVDTHIVEDLAYLKSLIANLK